MKNFNCDEYVFNVDGITGELYSLCDVIYQMKRQIEKLEIENKETTNTLYEIMNDIDSLKIILNNDVRRTDPV